MKRPINSPLQALAEADPQAQYIQDMVRILQKDLDTAKYAALGRACEANGLAGFNEDGTHWFQPPREVIEQDIGNRLTITFTPYAGGAPRRVKGVKDG